MGSITEYLNECRETNANLHTTERSYYPAVQDLLEARVSAAAKIHSELMIHRTDQPDLGIYEAGIPLVFLEVKKPGESRESLLGLEQAERYARVVSGYVIVTNLNDFILARLENEKLVEQMSVRLFEGEISDQSKPAVAKEAESKLDALLSAGCAERRVIVEPLEVAQLLALHARALMRSLPHNALKATQESFKKWLSVDLEDHFLTSTAVQAIAYGMFSTWIESDEPEKFEWRDTRDELPVGILAEIVYGVLNPTVIRHGNVRFILEGMAGLLRRAKRDQLASQFDDKAIEYFYEPFLREFDADLRDRMGVWYTPREIAAYQVARCDEHLKSSFGLDNGLGDETALVLDPACGTGTYLAETYDRLHKQFIDQGNTRDEAAALLSRAARIRVIGFEIMPAALMIADLHLRRLLRTYGVSLSSDERPAVYLTNSLTGWGTDSGTEQMSLQWPGATEEIEAANRYKKTEPILIVIGNPPYQGYSQASAEEKKLLEPWTRPLREKWGMVKHRMNDPYLSFWAMAVKRIAAMTNKGVVSFITNRKWLAGRSYPEMRASVLADFDEVYVDDLGGDSRADGPQGADESIFKTGTAPGVRVGTAIVTAVRTDEHSDAQEDTSLRYRRLAGTARTKRVQLTAYRDRDIDQDMQLTETSEAMRWRFTGRRGSDDWSTLDEYFEFFVSGVQPVREAALADHNREALAQRMAAYFNEDITWSELISSHPEFDVPPASSDTPEKLRKRLKARLELEEMREALLKRNKATNQIGHDPNRIVECLWRPLETRWLYWESDGQIFNRPRPELIPYDKIDGQRYLVAPQTPRVLSASRPLVSQVVPTFDVMNPNARALPLWSPPSHDGRSSSHDGNCDSELDLDHKDATAPARIPNVSQRWLTAARDAGLDESDEDLADLIFHAICGVVASPKWLASQPAQQDDFASVPLPSEPEELRAAAETGKKYAALVDPTVSVDGVTHGTLRHSVRGVGAADTPSEDPVKLTQGRSRQYGGEYSNGALLWNETEGWRNFTKAIHEFELGGFRPISKHLSYFVKQKLTSDDRLRITYMARRIVAIQELGPEADAHFDNATRAPLEAS